MNNTKSLIKKTYLNLYSKKDFYNISVKELCLSVPIARTTFYMHYRNTDDVKAEIEQELINGLSEISAGVVRSLSDKDKILCHFEEVAKFITDNKDEFCCFLIDRPNLRFIEMWKELIKSHAPIIFKNDPAVQELISEVIAGAVIAGQTCILKNIDSINNAEIKNLAVQALCNSVDFAQKVNTFHKSVV